MTACTESPGAEVRQPELGNLLHWDCPTFLGLSPEALHFLDEKQASLAGVRDLGISFFVFFFWSQDVRSTKDQEKRGLCRWAGGFLKKWMLIRVRVIFSQEFVHLRTLICNAEDMLVPVLMSLERIQLQLDLELFLKRKEVNCSWCETGG